MTRTVVHIDRLVLNDVDHADRHALAESLQTELQRLLGMAEFDLHSANSTQVSHLSASVIHADTNTSPAQLGSDAAQSVAKVIHSWTK